MHTPARIQLAAAVYAIVTFPLWFDGKHVVVSMPNAAAMKAMNANRIDEHESARPI